MIMWFIYKSQKNDLSIDNDPVSFSDAINDDNSDNG